MTQRSRHLCLAIGALIVFGRPVIAQSLARAETQVRATADSFFTAIAEGRWDAAARLLDLQRFAPFLAEQRASARSMMMPPLRMTVEQLMRSDTTMPRAVAEWEVARMNSHMTRQPPMFAFEFADVDSIGQLMALTPEQAAAKWLEAQDERYAMRLAWKTSGCGGPMPRSAIPAQPKNLVLAVALSGDSIGYAVYTGGPVDMGTFTVLGNQRAQLLTLRRTRGAWRVDHESFLQASGGLRSMGIDCTSLPDSAAKADEARGDLMGTLMMLRTAEEVFFVDSTTYTDKLQRLTSIHIPPNITVEPFVLAPASKGPGYQITVTSKDAPGWKCGMAVGKVPNPVDTTAAEGEPKCVKR